MSECKDMEEHNKRKREQEEEEEMDVEERRREAPSIDFEYHGMSFPLICILYSLFLEEEKEDILYPLLPRQRREVYLNDNSSGKIFTVTDLRIILERMIRETRESESLLCHERMMQRLDSQQELFNQILREESRDSLFFSEIDLY